MSEDAKSRRFRVKTSVVTAIPIGWDWSMVAWITGDQGNKFQRGGWALTRKRAWRDITEAIQQARILLGAH